jgi:hypothetical protein
MESYVRIGEGVWKILRMLDWELRGVKNCQNHAYVINEWPLTWEGKNVIQFSLISGCRPCNLLILIWGCFVALCNHTMVLHGQSKSGNCYLCALPCSRTVSPVPTRRFLAMERVLRRARRDLKQVEDWALQTCIFLGHDCFSLLEVYRWIGSQEFFSGLRDFWTKTRGKLGRKIILVNSHICM